MVEAQTPNSNSSPDRFRRSTGLRRSDLVIAVTAVVLLSLLAGSVIVTAQHYRRHQYWIVHSYQAREQILELTDNLQTANTEARSYGLTGRNVAFQQYWRSMADVEQNTDVLADLLADNPTRVAALKQLRDAIASRRRQFEQVLGDYRTQGPAAARAQVDALIQHPSTSVHNIANRMLVDEAALLKLNMASSDRDGRNLVVTAAATLGGCFLLLIFALFNVGREQRHRFRNERELKDTARRLEQALHDASHASTTLHRLARLTELLQNCRDLAEAIQVIERALPPLLSNTSGCLATINASRNIVETRMHWGERGSELADGVFAPDDCWALRRGQAHPRPGDTTAPVCMHLMQSGVTAAHTLCLPLSAQGQVLGVLSLCAIEPISADTRQLGGTVADQLALALGNLQLQASLRTQSIRDPLTNLFNRRYLEASLARELMRAQRRQGGLSVLMLDLDHFKRYNDAQGHDAGDALLEAFAALLAQSCRSEDIPCRFGGEEFIVVLTDADHAHGMARAEPIRAAAAGLIVHYRSGTLPTVTVSIGVASFPEHGDTPEALLRMADQALYRAKQLDRDRVASANHLALGSKPKPTAMQP